MYHRYLSSVLGISAIIFIVFYVYLYSVWYFIIRISSGNFEIFLQINHLNISSNINTIFSNDSFNNTTPYYPPVSIALSGQLMDMDSLSSWQGINLSICSNPTCYFLPKHDDPDTIKAADALMVRPEWVSRGWIDKELLPLNPIRIGAHMEPKRVCNAVFESYEMNNYTILRSWTFPKSLGYDNTHPPYIVHFDFIMPYYIWSYATLIDPVSELSKTYPKFALWRESIQPKSSILFIQSNCGNWYGREVKHLMHSLKIDSYGSCNRNRALPFGLESWTNEMYLQKLAIQSKYRYVLAFENSFEDDWVTERFYHAFVTASVPVYIGGGVERVYNVSMPDCIKNRLPDRDSIIWLGDFSGRDQFIDYMQNEIEDVNRYVLRQNWRKRPQLLPENFRTFGNRSPDKSMCEVCRIIAQIKNNETVVVHSL